MESRNKGMGKVALGVLSSLSESYTLLPFMVFSSLISEKTGKVDFLVPVIVIYSIERACLIGLRGLGEIRNPQRIMKGGLSIAILGALLMLISCYYYPLLMVSAVLVGIGLAPLRAMFVPLFSALVEKDKELKKAKNIGTLLYLAIMVVAMALGGLSLPVVPVLFLLYLCYCLHVVAAIDGDELFGKERAFDRSSSNPAFIVFGILALVCLLILRQYQTSGISYLMWATPIIVVTFTAIEIYRHRDYRDYSYSAYWVGAVKSFLVLYSLVYHTSVEDGASAMLVYLALAVSSMVSPIVGKIMGRKLGGKVLIKLCLILSSLFSFLLVVPQAAISLLGLFLSSTWANVISSEVGARYMEDSRYIKNERALVRFRLQTAGSIIEQLCLFFTIYIMGDVSIHENILAPYAAGVPDAWVSLPLRASGFICSLLLLAAALAIVFFSGKRKAEVR